MAVSEPRRIARHHAADDSWGVEAADTMMELVTPPGGESAATRSDIQAFVHLLDAMEKRLQQQVQQLLEHTSEQIEALSSRLWCAVLGAAAVRRRSLRGPRWRMEGPPRGAAQRRGGLADPYAGLLSVGDPGRARRVDPRTGLTHPAPGAFPTGRGPGGQRDVPRWRSPSNLRADAPRPPRAPGIDAGGARYVRRLGGGSTSARFRSRGLPVASIARSRRSQRSGSASSGLARPVAVRLGQ